MTQNKTATTPFTFTLEDDDGEEVEYSVPAKLELCSNCNGEGKTVDPNIDGNGITSSEWAELCDGDSDFAENYMGGKYDITCEECGGTRVVKVIDEELLTEEQKELVERYYKCEAANAAYDREDAHTRRMERGY
jgi:DnaJ-class molecular chaperone